MPLEKNWRVIFRFAVAGFLTATLAALCMVSNAPDFITYIMIFLSPGFLLLIEWVWARIPINNSDVALWSSVGLVAVVNGVIYAIAGALMVGLLRLLNHKADAR